MTKMGLFSIFLKERLHCLKPHNDPHLFYYAAVCDLLLQTRHQQNTSKATSLSLLAHLKNTFIHGFCCAIPASKYISFIKPKQFLVFGDISGSTLASSIVSHERDDISVSW